MNKNEIINEIKNVVKNQEMELSYYDEVFRWRDELRAKICFSFEIDGKYYSITTKNSYFIYDWSDIIDAFCDCGLSQQEIYDMVQDSWTPLEYTYLTVEDAYNDKQYFNCFIFNDKLLNELADAVIEEMNKPKEEYEWTELTINA